MRERERERERENFNEYVLKLIGEVSNDIELADESDVKLFLKKKKKKKKESAVKLVNYLFGSMIGKAHVSWDRITLIHKLLTKFDGSVSNDPI